MATRVEMRLGNQVYNWKLLCGVWEYVRGNIGNISMFY